jgi:hypothetical protein
MTNDKSKTGDMATICDVLGLPEQRNDIEFFLSASGNYGLEIHSDLEEFLDNFSGEDWLDDLQQLSSLSGEIKHFGQILEEIVEALPDHPVTKKEAQKIMEGVKFSTLLPMKNTSFMANV